MKLILIGCVVFFFEIGYAAVHPIKEVSVVSQTDRPNLYAKILLKDSCVKLDGNTLLIDSRQNVITLMQQVVENSQITCSQMITPKISEFALNDLPTGLFELIDGYDNSTLGVLQVTSEGEISLLE